MSKILPKQRWRYVGPYSFLIEVVDLDRAMLSGRVIQNKGSSYGVGEVRKWSQFDLMAGSNNGWYYLAGQDAPNEI